MSQAQLADAAEVSARHLSCLETGKARASREMVLVLSSALDLPLRERNALLHAAGFAPAYASRPLDSDDLRQVRHALELMLGRQEPFPAIVCDRGWNIVQMNAGARRLIDALDLDPQALGPALSNAMHVLFHEKGLRTKLANFAEVGAAVVARLRRDARHGDGHAATVLAELPGCIGADLPDHGAPEREPGAVLPLRLRLEHEELALFTTITTLGTPLDVTAEELRIESYFPADAATEQWFLRPPTRS